MEFSGGISPGAYVRGNTFRDTELGLQLNSGTTIGLQNNANNKWPGYSLQSTVNGSAVAATHQSGDIEVIKQSQFIVHPNDVIGSQTYPYHTTPAIPGTTVMGEGEWFRNYNAAEHQFPLTSPQPCTYAAPFTDYDGFAETETDIWKKIAGDRMHYDRFVNEQRWAADWHLYHFLKHRPTILAAEPVLNGRFQQLQSTNIGVLADFFYPIHDIALTEDPTTLPQRQSIAYLNAMTPQNDAEAMMQEVLLLQHDLLSRNRTVLTSAETIMLETVATTCPLLGGPVVYRARGLYDLYVGKATYDDDNTCNAVHQARSKAASTPFGWRMTLAPNPAQADFVELFISKPEVNYTGSYTIVVSNMSGVELKTEKGETDNGYHLLNTTELPSGMYFVRVVFCLWPLSITYKDFTSGGATAAN